MQETDDLILIDIDNGSVSTSCSETLDLPQIPPAAAECFTQRYSLHYQEKHKYSYFLEIVYRNQNKLTKSIWIWAEDVKLQLFSNFLPILLKDMKMFLFC